MFHVKHCPARLAIVSCETIEKRVESVILEEEKSCTKWAAMM